ncbi:PREDICTED: importin-11-like [Branchiostoma belcheri]|uniref:Importin-11 n=1 Tax=Branchiostoma belcheri TaxID=7741 RepID=A0A6P4Y3Y4_BRABE|nr:PREDICTED: importin-11-like [Branchiostoma belcheri]
MDFATASSVVLETLTKATSQDQTILKPAEQQLKQWETQPGFYSILVTIFSNHAISLNVRWLAVLYFKNGVDRYWRRTAPNAIPEEEKNHLRKQLIANFNEPVNQVATQLSVLIAKVARVDCPRAWPELIPTLLEAVKSPEVLLQQRALLTLHHVTKTLATKRLAGDRKIFQELAGNIFSFVYNLWNSHMETFLQSVATSPGNTDQLLPPLERCLLTLKVCRKLAVHGFTGAETMPDVMALLSATYPRIKSLLPLRKDFSTHAQLKEKLEKLIILLTKVLLDMLEYHAVAFVPFIQPTLEFTVSYVFTETGEGMLFERFTVQCLNLVKAIIKCDNYRPAKEISETKEPATIEAYKCGDVILKKLCILGPVNPEDVRALLQKDAVYSALGLASYELYDVVDFDQWFQNQLLVELQCKHPRYKIIRRRVIWLIGQWIGVKFSVDLRPMMYEAILPLLGTEEDLVVRITAANTLRIAVDDFEFKTEQFLPYLERNFSLLFHLLQQVSECDTKMQVLHVLSFVIERVGPEIRPYVSSLVQYLPMLWEESAEHNMLRCAIITTLIHLVQGVGPLCMNLFPFLLPVIQFSTDVTQPPHVYLMEDGVDLWHVTLQSATSVTPELLQLFNNMPALLELGSETLRVCFSIVDSYVLLGPGEFLQMYSGMLHALLSDMMTDLRPEGVTHICRVIENMFRVFPVEAPQLFPDILSHAFKAVLDKEELPQLMSMYLVLIARVMLQNNTFFFTFLSSLASKVGQQPGEVLGTLLDIWMERLDCISQPERRKLSALALASLLVSTEKVIVERFCAIVNCCVEVLHDCCREDYTDILLMTENNPQPEDEMEMEEDRRRRQLSIKDPVHSVSLRDFVHAKLQECQQTHGQDGFQKLMDTVDVEIKEQLQRFIK